MANLAQTMADIESSKITATKLGFFDLKPEDRKRIYQFSLVSHDVSPIMVLETGIHAPGQDLLAISPCSLSAQLLRTCHQVLKEAQPILYKENSFTLHLRNHVPIPREIAIKITSGNLRTLRRVVISIDALPTLGHALHQFVNCFPSLEALRIQGKMVTMSELQRNVRAQDTVAQKCRRESVVQLIIAFGGLPVFRGFLIQHSNLELEYRMGIGANITTAAPGAVVPVEQASSIKYRGNELLTGRAVADNVHARRN